MTTRSIVAQRTDEALRRARRDERLLSIHAEVIRGWTELLDRAEVLAARAEEEGLGAEEARASSRAIVRSVRSSMVEMAEVMKMGAGT